MTALSPALRVMRAIERVGAAATLLGREEQGGFPASIQPVRDRSLQPLREGPWGIDRRRRAAMFAPWCEAAGALQVEDRLSWQGQNYRVLQVETVEFAGEPLYVWAMLEQQGREQKSEIRDQSTEKAILAADVSLLSSDKGGEP